MDATLGHEAWIGELPVDQDGERPYRSGDPSTVAVAGNLVDATIVTSPAVGLGAETHEVHFTVLNGATGDVIVESVFPSFSDSYAFWVSPHYQRVLLGVGSAADDWSVYVFDGSTGEEVVEIVRPQIMGDGVLEGRYQPMIADGAAEAVRFLDLQTGELTAVEMPLHRRFEYEDGACSPFLFVHADEHGEWDLVDPVAGTVTRVPDRYSTGPLTAVGGVISSSAQWAMLTPAGLAWNIDRSLANRALQVDDELSFQNQSGERIAVDPATGADLGPAVFVEPVYVAAADGLVADGAGPVRYVERTPCQ